MGNLQVLGGADGPPGEALEARAAEVSVWFALALMRSPHVLACLNDLVLELFEIHLHPVQIGAPAGARPCVVHSALDLGIGRTVEAGHLGMVEGAVMTFGDGQTATRSNAAGGHIRIPALSLVILDDKVLEREGSRTHKDASPVTAYLPKLPTG